MSQHDLGKCVTDSLQQYFRDLDGEKPCAIYDMVLKNVEKPMLEVVMRHADAGILLVRAQMTTTGVVSTALDRLGRNTVSGAVLNVFS